MYIFSTKNVCIRVYTHTQNRIHTSWKKKPETYVVFYNDIVLRTNNSVKLSGISNNNILYRLVWTALLSHLHCRSLAMKAIFDLPDQLLLLHHELEWNALPLMQLMSRVWFAIANATLFFFNISSSIALFFILHCRRENIHGDTFRLFSFHVFHT